MNPDSELLFRFHNIIPGARLKQTTLDQLHPAITLWLIDPEGWDKPLTQEQASAVTECPPYWSFCWGSGKALANWVTQNRHKFAGKTILDVGSGSGVVAIACAMAGAARVTACDIDPLSLLAVQQNALLNGVQIELLENLADYRGRADYLFAADVLYDPDNLKLVDDFLELADSVLLADSRIKQFAAAGYQLVDAVNAVTVPDLGENEDVKQVRLYCGRKGSQSA